MAGVKGRSGGARPNTGGKRPGAGRKPKAPAAEMAGEPVPSDPMAFLIAVMEGRIDPTGSQLKAAQTAARIQAQTTGTGKRAQREAAAKVAGAGRFAAPSGPRLAAVGGRKVGSA